MTQALQILQKTFGYDQFRDQQAEIIEHVINGNNCLVIMPTGGGKSLCYQIPAMLRSGTGIVISPLIALMQDQVTALLQAGVKASYLNSTLAPSMAYEIEQQLLRGELDLLYLAPERLLGGQLMPLLEQANIGLIAIDEAHCVSQWGHDFRPEYMQLSILKDKFPDVPRIALTATADDRTRREIFKGLALEGGKLFSSGFDRPNIRYRVTEKQNPRQQLLRFMRDEHADDAGIVYCMSRKKVNDLANYLQQEGWNALPYHAGMSDRDRKQNQDRFLKEESVVMVATIAFGMGIDKPNVRFVAHMDLPKSLEAYYQETGRGGRDGLPADAWMVYGLQDIIQLRQMMESEDLPDEQRRVNYSKLDALLGFCEVTQCRRKVLLNYFGDLLDKPCGNCDTCLQPVETWDGTVAAQKALSCVYRTGQRFGVNYILDVLMGKDNPRIFQFNHHKLSTYGIGKELNANEWRSVFRQLIARGLLNVDHEGFGSLKLTDQCRSLLKGEETIQLRKVIKAKTEKKAKRNRHFGKEADSQLWEALRAERQRLAKLQGIPPYAIFHDATLMEMVSVKPQSSMQFIQLSGVGDTKLRKYGDDFLAIIANYLEQHKGHSDTVHETITMFQQGKKPKQIAYERELKTSTVYGHLAIAIENGILPLEQVIELKKESLERIRACFDGLMDEEKERPLKHVFELLNGEYDFPILRCVQAAMIE